MTGSNVRPEDQFQPKNANEAFWDSVALVFRRKRFVLAITIAAAIVSVIVSILLPKWYTASTTVILPTKSDGGIGSLLSRNISSAASSLITGSSTGDYSRYLTILQSRSAMERLVNEYDLIAVYETDDSEFPLEDAIVIARDNIALYVDNEYDYLEISVTDKDPDRAAQMANYLTRVLNDINNNLSSEVAGNFRRSVERRFVEARTERDSLFAGVQAFQSKFGVYDLETQTQVFFEQVGELRAMILKLEVEYESLRDRYGEANSQVKAAASAVRSARRKYDQALAGKEAIFPIAQDTIPAVVRKYAELELNRVIQTKVAEVLAPLVEQAKFDELRTADAVQVIDTAVRPTKKSKPKRAVICIVGTLSAFMLSILYLLSVMWIKHLWAFVSDRLQTGRSSVS